MSRSGRRDFVTIIAAAIVIAAVLVMVGLAKL